MPYSNRTHTLYPPLLAFVLLSLITVAVQAQTIPPPPQMPVRGYVLMDHQSGNLLADLKG